MADQTSHWSDANWSAKAVPDLSATFPARTKATIPSLLLKWLVAFAASLLLASTLYGYFLIAQHNAAFKRFSDAETVKTQTLELTRAIIALDHAERRFNATSLQDELDDVQQMMHGVRLAMFKTLDLSPSNEVHLALGRLSDGLEEHRRLLLTLLQADNAARQQTQFSETSTARLFGTVADISSYAVEQSTRAEAEFNETSVIMYWVVGSADLALLLGGSALFALHRRRFQRLAKSQKSLFDNNRTLRAAIEDRTTRLGQVEAMFKSSLAASNMTMFIQNTDLVVSWIHNPKFGDGETLIGKRDQDFMPPDAWRQTVKFKHEVINSGIGQHLEYSYCVDGRAIHKWLQIDPILEAGRVIGIIGVAVDVTARRQRESKIEALAAELAHRNQNLIAVVSAIARQMLKTSDTLNEFEDRFITRLYSIARSFELIVEEDWQGAPLHELVRAQIIAVDKTLLDRVKISGKNILVSPKFAESIGAAIHELAQNALAYGAFAAPTGKVLIDWWIDADVFNQKTLSFIWTESDGSDTIPSIDHQGYGLNVLEKVVPNALNGSAFVVAQHGGLKWRMRCAWKEPALQNVEDVSYLHA